MPLTTPSPSLSTVQSFQSANAIKYKNNLHSIFTLFFQIWQLLQMPIKDKNPVWIGLDSTKIYDIYRRPSSHKKDILIRKIKLIINTSMPYQKWRSPWRCISGLRAQKPHECNAVTPWQYHIGWYDQEKSEAYPFIFHLFILKVKPLINGNKYLQKMDLIGYFHCSKNCSLYHIYFIWVIIRLLKLRTWELIFSPIWKNLSEISRYPHNPILSFNHYELFVNYIYIYILRVYSK